jgi:hypothetical protein
MVHFRKNFIFFFIKLFKFDLIFETALRVAAPFRSVVDDAALADVLGTLDVLLLKFELFHMVNLKNLKLIEQFLYEYLDPFQYHHDSYVHFHLYKYALVLQLD